MFHNIAQFFGIIKENLSIGNCGKELNACSVGIVKLSLELEIPYIYF